MTHSNIVTAFDFFESDENYCLVMEHLNGYPLSTILKNQLKESEGFAFDENEARQIFIK